MTPLLVTETTVGVTVFVTSISSMLNVPDALSALLLSVKSALALSVTPTVIVGESFVPVMVTVTSC